MRRLAILAILALAACDNGPEIVNGPAPIDRNVVGYDRCGDPVYEGQPSRQDNQPCP